MALTVVKTSALSGTLPVANGGIGITSGTTDQFLKFTGTTTLASATDNAGDLVLLASVNASSSSTVDFTGHFTSDYYTYILYFNNVKPSNDDDHLGIRIRQSGGGSFDSGANDYGNGRYGRRSDGDGASADLATGDMQYNRIPLNNGAIEKGGDWNVNGYVKILTPLQATYKVFEFSITYGYTDTNNISSLNGGGVRYCNPAMDGIQFLTETGTIDEGNFRLYGVKNA